VLRWRYGEALRWRLVTIGLTEHADQYVRRGYTPARQARGYRAFRRYGMPFATTPRRRIAATSRACRAVVAVRLTAPEREHAAFRALQFGWFTTDLVLDEDEHILQALARVPGIDAGAIVAQVDAPAVVAAYEADRAEARTAAGGPAEFQGKTANTDGLVRYTAPSLVFVCGDRRLEAGGFQPVAAYDVLIANLDSAVERRPPPDTPLAALERSPDGLVTQEVAAIMAWGNDEPDRAAAEEALIELAAEGDVVRVPLGDDALWLARAAVEAGAERRRAA
jgi:2-hydroxychromene-2-carboxylate isomerase